MYKLDINNAADEFEMISDEHQLFYNIETGEFETCIDPIYSGLPDDSEKFEDDCWIAAPSQRDLCEYGIMADFADTITDPRKNELLSVALEGSGAFRRFKDTLHRTQLTDKWYAFKHDAYVELARNWCEENGIKYIDTREKPKQIPLPAIEREVSARNGVMVYLGSDDETGRTSLYGVDLYNDTFGKLSNIQNVGGHPFTFYEKMGYKIVGVFPDANGTGKPDIWMAKRI
jgi:hypothetical protein